MYNYISVYIYILYIIYIIHIFVVYSDGQSLRTYFFFHFFFVLRT